MPPVTQYVFAETLKLSIYFTAGSHEWLPYSVFLGISKKDRQTPIFRLPYRVDNMN